VAKLKTVSRNLPSEGQLQKPSSRDGLSEDRDSNPGPSEYEADVVKCRPLRSVNKAAVSFVVLLLHILTLNTSNISSELKVLPLYKILPLPVQWKTWRYGHLRVLPAF
jgi:hypothetical protein